MASPAEDKDQQTRTASLPFRPGGGPGPQRGAAVVGMPGRGDARPAQAPQPAGRGVLVIGREIEVRGEIGRCETIVVEGRLEAAVEVGTLELAEEGYFNGRATVQTADIAGQLDGELTVAGELHLRPSARVQGVIRYGRLVIEGGGEISGDVAVLPPEQRARALEG